MDKTRLGNRMKKYEGISKSYLTPRTPVIIRLDGKAFHTWTRKLSPGDEQDDPFNEEMHTMMLFATQHIMQNMQNVEVAYTQSDEISILMNDWRSFTTDQWFDNNVQKIASVTAAAASAAFNFIATQNGYITCAQDLALFDSRVFTLPKEEVNNYFVWRQQDATRNSINMLGQHWFSHKELQCKNVSQVQDMLMTVDNGINWNDLDVWKKRGSCIVRDVDSFRAASPWNIDCDIPIFSKDPDYIEQHLLSDGERERVED